MVADVALTDAGKQLADVLARGGCVRVPATMETFAWLSRIEQRPMVVESGNDADESVLAAMQVTAQTTTLSPSITLSEMARLVRDDAPWSRGCVFVGSFDRILRTDATATATALFSTVVDDHLRLAHREHAPLVESRHLRPVDASFERLTLEQIAKKLGVAEERIPRSSSEDLLRLVCSALPTEQASMIARLAAFGRGGDTDWWKRALTDNEYEAMLQLVELGLLALFERRTVLLSALRPRRGAEALHDWSRALRSLASNPHDVDPRTVVELHRVLASSSDRGEQREAASWARFGASVLLDRASHLSKRREFSSAAELYDAVISLAKDGGVQAADPRSVAYAIHYRAFNRFHANELSGRQLVTEYRRSVARWPENTLFWERLVLAAGGFVRRAGAPFDSDAHPAFESMFATHAEARRATPDTPETCWHLFDRVVNKLDEFGASGWMASLPLLDRAHRSSPPGTKSQTPRGFCLDARWLWAKPNARLGLVDPAIVLVEQRGHVWRVECESLAIEPVEDSSLERAWNVFVDRALRSVERQLCGDARDREQCPALDESWTAGGSSLSRWVASLSRLRLDVSPALAGLRKAAHHLASSSDRPQLDLRDGVVELYWRGVDQREGELLVRLLDGATATARWNVDGRVVDRPTFCESVEQFLAALGAPTLASEILPSVLMPHFFQAERGAIYRAPSPGPVELLDGSRQTPVPAFEKTATAYFFDPTPSLLWSHECWFAFFDPNLGPSPRYFAMWPPRDLDRWISVKVGARE